MSFLGGASERLQFVLSLDERGAIQAFKKVGDAAEKNLGKADDRLNRIGGQMQVAGAAAVGFAAVAGRALFSFAKASEEAEAEHRKLTLALENSPQLAGVTEDAFIDLADSMQDTTTAEGDAVIGLEGLLGTLGLTKDQILELTPLVVDFATRFGLGFDQAARLVNGALNGSTGRLERFIGQIGESESVVDALRRTVGGFAEQEAQTLSGQLTILKNNFGDIKEAIGVGVVGALNTAIGPLTGFVDKIAESDPALLTAAGRFATIGTAAAGGIGSLAVLAGSVEKAKESLTGATGVARVFAKAAQFAGVAAAAGTVAVAIKAIDDAAHEFGDQLKSEAQGALDTSQDFDQFRGNLAHISNEIDRMDSILEGSQAPWDADKRQQYRVAQEELQRLEATYAPLEADILNLARAEGISRDEATRVVLARDDQRMSHEALVAAVGETAAAEQEAADAAAEHQRKADALTAALDREREANENLVDSTLARLGGEIALRAAERNTVDETAEAILATEQYGVMSREASEATDEAAAAALAQADAAAEVAREQGEANGVQQTAAEKARIQREELEKVAATLAPGSALRIQLQGYIDELANIETDITTNVNLKVNRFGDLAFGVGAGFAGAGGKRQHGGPVVAGRPYLVGEQGPELVVPQSSGTVVPNEQIGGITLNVYGEPDDFTLRRLRHAAIDAADAVRRSQAWSVS